MKEIKAELPSKPIQMGKVTYRRLSNDEALKEFGTSFVFIGGLQKPSPEKAEQSNKAVKQIGVAKKKKRS